MGIKRGPLSADNFTLVPHDWTRAKGLSWKEKGLLAYIAGHKADYDLTVYQIIEDGEDGKESVESGIKALVRKGYLKRVRQRNADGTLGAYDYTVVENPDSVSAGHDQCRVSHAGKPGTGADQGKQGVSAGHDQSGVNHGGSPADKEDHSQKIKEKNNNTSSPVADAPAGGESKGKKAPKEEPARPEVERLCQLLADLIAADGTKRPQVTKAWRDECRRLMDLDGATEKQVEYVVRWSQAHPFWSTNILSMPKLRQQYAALVKRIKAEHVKPVSGGAPVKSFKQQDDEHKAQVADYFMQAREAWMAAHPGQSASSGAAMAEILTAAKAMENAAKASATNDVASCQAMPYSGVIEGESYETAPLAIGGGQS